MKGSTSSMPRRTNRWAGVSEDSLPAAPSCASARMANCWRGEARTAPSSSGISRRVNCCDRRRDRYALGGWVGTSCWLDAVASAPDGKRAAIGGDSVELWNLQSCEEFRSLPGYRIVGLSFSNDGKRLVSAGETGVRLYE